MSWKYLLAFGGHMPEMVEPLQVISQERLSRILDSERGGLEIPDGSCDIIKDFKQ